MACPFGKTNSPLEFCEPVSLFAKSVAARYPKGASSAPILRSYVDDIFGGIPNSELFGKSLALRRYICDTGATLTICFNLKPTKTPLPARRQVILGRVYDSLARRVKTSEKKRSKYLQKISKIRNSRLATVTEIQQVHGYLNYVASIAPFGRPFLTLLTMAIRGLKRSIPVKITNAVGSDLSI